MRYTGRVNFIYKAVGAIIFSVGLLLLPVVSFAQDQECLDVDPIGGSCPTPLDTWVIVLAVAALIFASVHLHHKQKRNVRP